MGSPIFPAWALNSAMVAYSLRRYIWMTFSMCALRSARPLFDLPVWVQIRWLMRFSSKSARCMTQRSFVRAGRDQ